jgi:hypothetical protein
MRSPQGCDQTTMGSHIQRRRSRYLEYPEAVADAPLAFLAP